MSVTAAVAWGLALILVAASYWVRRQRRHRRRFTTRATKPVQVAAPTVMPNASRVLVYIDHEGSARELTEAEKTYVDTEFSPFDGARPYVKSNYEQRNGWGELSGYLPREKVPEALPIGAAPPESPSQSPAPQAVAGSILELVRKHRPEDAHRLRFKLPP